MKEIKVKEGMTPTEKVLLTLILVLINELNHSFDTALKYSLHTITDKTERYRMKKKITDIYNENKDLQNINNMNKVINEITPKRPHRYIISLSAEEKNLLFEKSKQNNTTVSSIVRFLLTNQKSIYDI